MAGLYIHIPFCKQACHYCDFHFSTQHDQMDNLCKALQQELVLQKDFLGGESLQTIYVGGGTPSLLSISQLQALFECIHRHYTVIQNAEITLEANPDDIDLNSANAWKMLGINRLSIGIQSFNDGVLKFLNRSHSGDQALRAMEIARQAGINNLNADLIYAIPGRDINQLDHELGILLEQKPDHISAYSLTIEPQTAFGNWYQKKKFNPESDEESARQFTQIMHRLKAAGYEHYEISNYALPGSLSKHNTNYWRQQPYLGIGPSAHSYNGEERWINAPNNYAYIKALTNGELPNSKEVLSPLNKINEYIMTSLRTQWGCHVNFLKEAYGFDLLIKQQAYIAEATQQGLLIVEADTIRLTDSGKLFADSIAAQFFEV